MKSSKKVQITMEFIFLLSLIVIVLIPLSMIIINYTSLINQEYQEKQLFSYTLLITNKANVLYHSGIYNKDVIKPPKISNIEINDVFITKIFNSTTTEYYFVVNYSNYGNERIIMEYSSIPITNETVCKEPENIVLNLFKECDGISLNCTRCPINKEKFTSQTLYIEVVLNETLQARIFN
jgi:hypothetical protein